MINSTIKNAMDCMGFSSLNPIQQKVAECNAENIAIVSSTGSGKTFAFLIAALKYCQHSNGTILILAPSRELSYQIEEVFRKSKSGYNVTCCYGGHSIEVERRSLEYQPRVIVGTPGRILDHITKGNINPLSIGMIIFDEFDKLFEFGFDDEMAAIVKRVSRLTHRVLSSATRQDNYPNYISNNLFEEIEHKNETLAKRMVMKVVKSTPESRLDTLFSLLCDISHEPTLVFCNYREASKEVSDYLYDEYLENEYFHGGMEQFDREKALAKFRNKSCNILVSTDLAARGIDIENIKNIIHYQLPDSPESFVHRNGRTARVDRSGSIYIIDDRSNSTISDIVPDIDKMEQYTPHSDTPPQPQYTTLYIGMGKKNKLSRVDIVGFLCQKGDIEKSDIGLIELKDFHSFVAVRYDLAKEVARRVFKEKIKGRRCKISIAK